ncbi:hypothetical protein [Candidatus Formimonas warabiya]|uniref:Uncharacterized protein n=1 Tax=Formimonas warabiya TaxID=1761012 RepID=A0A3G1KM40_FORW1|nr:hypothetical protein [Candidatus Formimonas warabiya]ATW23474.1 hypothetical protein DCMF_00485 [Candidatus Formimonas warabiya]
MSYFTDNSNHKTLYAQTRKFVEANIAVHSNCTELIYPDMYMDPEVQKRQPEKWRSVNGLGVSQIVDPAGKPDAVLYVLNESGPNSDLRLLYHENEYVIAGPLLELEKNPPDRRYTVYGCGGLLTKIMVTTLEDHHGICSLHATSMYSEKDNHLLLAIGGPGAGKTILLLEACLRKGYKVLTTEYTHFKTAGDSIIFYKGSLFDNVRVGNLIYDFPEYEAIWGKEIITDTKNVWDTKVALDFQPLQVEENKIINPEVTIVFPKIESQRTSADIQTISSYQTLFQFFLNAGEQINRPRLLYGRLPFSSFDSKNRGMRRLKLVQDFLDQVNLRAVKTIFAGVKNSWPL